eukprot:1176279-Prorocentrum_minimum.AAC.3
MSKTSSSPLSSAPLSSAPLSSRSALEPGTDSFAGDVTRQTCREARPAKKPDAPGLPLPSANTSPRSRRLSPPPNLARRSTFVEPFAVKQLMDNLCRTAPWGLCLPEPALATRAGPLLPPRSDLDGTPHAWCSCVAQAERNACVFVTPIVSRTISLRYTPEKKRTVYPSYASRESLAKTSREGKKTASGSVGAVQCRFKVPYQALALGSYELDNCVTIS